MASASKFILVPAGSESDDSEFNFGTGQEPVESDEENIETLPICKIKNNQNVLLNGLEFDWELDEKDLDSLMEIQSIFTGDPDDKVAIDVAEKFLLNMFSQRKQNIFGDDTYSFALKLVLNVVDSKTPRKNTTPYKIVKTLERFVHEQSPEDKQVLKWLLTDNVRKVAFEISYRNNDFFQLVCEVFDLKSDIKLIKNRLQKIFEIKDFKSIARITNTLGMWNEFGIEEIVIPLIFQDRLQVVQDYFTKMSTELKLEVLLFLDKFLENEDTCDEKLLEYAKNQKIPKIQTSKLDVQPLCKTIKMLAETSGIAIDRIPNINRIATKTRLHHILQSCYVKECANQYYYENAIKELVKPGDKQFQEMVLQYCSNFGSANDVRKWRIYFNVLHPEAECSTVLQKSTEMLNQVKPTKKLHLFQLDKSIGVTLVQDELCFKVMCENLKRCTIVGIDIEGGTRTNTMALLQIATCKSVYLVDVLQLEKERFQQCDWSELVTVLFNNRNILKIVFSWTNDSIMLEKTIPHIDFDDSYLDLSKIWDYLSITFTDFKLPFQYEHSDKLEHKDLKTLTEFCTNSTLNKNVRKSDFTQRPLPEHLISYAAADAACLLKNYFAMKQAAAECGIDINSLISM